MAAPVISRRDSLILLSVISAGAFVPRAFALTPAKDLRDVWPEVQSGAFATAAERLQLHVMERPLDHKARTDLAILQFAAGSFIAAAENLEREIRLRRSYARTEPTSTDFDAVECWHYLAKLRAGQGPEVPRAQYQASLLSLLGGQVTLDEFLQQGLAAQDAAYERAEQMMKVIAEAMQQATDKELKKVAQLFSYQKPDRQTVIASLSCPARLMLGEQALGQEDAASARKHLIAAIATRTDTMVEYHIAKAELGRLG